VTVHTKYEPTVLTCCMTNTIHKFYRRVWDLWCWRLWICRLLSFGIWE